MNKLLKISLAIAVIAGSSAGYSMDDNLPECSTVCEDILDQGTASLQYANGAVTVVPEYTQMGNDDRWYAYSTDLKNLLQVVDNSGPEKFKECVVGEPESEECGAAMYAAFMEGIPSTCPFKKLPQDVQERIYGQL